MPTKKRGAGRYTGRYLLVPRARASARARKIHRKIYGSSSQNYSYYCASCLLCVCSSQFAACMPLLTPIKEQLKIKWGGSPAPGATGGPPHPHCSYDS